MNRMSQSACRCKEITCFKCLVDWKNDMLEKEELRRVKYETDYCSTFGVNDLSAEEVKDQIRPVLSPQIYLQNSELNYNNVTNVLCCMLEDFSPTKSALLSIPQNSTDLSLLEVINVINEYKLEESSEEGQLLNALAELNTEMQKYKRETTDRKELHRVIIGKCQAFLLQYKYLSELPSVAHQPDMRSGLFDDYHRLQKRLDNLNASLELFEETDEPDPQGHDVRSVELCAPYCLCHKCIKRKGYMSVEKKNKQQTIQTYYDAEVPKRHLHLKPIHRNRQVQESENRNMTLAFRDFSEDGSYSDASSIDIDIPYYSMIRQLLKAKANRKLNRDETAAVEQKLMSPKTHKDVGLRLANIYSEYDENHVIHSVKPEPFRATIRPHQSASNTSYTPWRQTNRMKVGL